MIYNVEFYNKFTEEKALLALLDNGFVKDLDGHLVLERYCVFVSDINSYVHKHRTDIYIKCNHCQECYSRHNDNDTIDIEGDLYCNSICAAAAGNYLSSDGYWRNYRQSPLSGYHGRSRTFYDTTESEPYLIGFEIEKEDIDIIDEMYDKKIELPSGWIAERDSSLSDDCGFELVTPAYNLANQKLILKDFESVRKLLDAKSSIKCGGHITISRRDYTGNQLVDSVKGLFPLILCLYPKRLKNEYSPYDNIEQIKVKRTKYMAFKVDDDKVELRLPSRVLSHDCLVWRYKLIKFVLENQMSVAKVRNSLNDGQLYAYLRQVFSANEVDNRIDLFESFADAFLFGAADENVKKFVSEKRLNQPLETVDN